MRRRRFLSIMAACQDQSVRVDRLSGPRRKGVWGSLRCTGYVHSAYRTGIGRGFEAHVRYREHQERAPEIRSHPLEEAASRRSVEAPGREEMPISSDFSIHIRPVTDALLVGQGVCACTTREGTLPWLSVPITNAGRRATVQKPLDFVGILADTTCGIRRNSPSERDSEVTIWRKVSQKRLMIVVFF